MKKNQPNEVIFSNKLIKLDQVAKIVGVCISSLRTHIKRSEKLQSFLVTAICKFPNVRKTKRRTYKTLAIYKSTLDSFIKEYNTFKMFSYKRKLTKIGWTESALECLKANLTCSKCPNHSLICKSIYRKYGEYPMKKIVLRLLKNGNPLKIREE